MPKHTEKCSECDYTHWDKRQMGRHKNKVHDIPGRNAKYKQRKSKTELVVSKPRIMKKEHENAELYAYIVSKLEDIVHRVAFEHDLPERKFAQGFAQYLSRS